MPSLSTKRSGLWFGPAGMPTSWWWTSRKCLWILSRRGRLKDGYRGGSAAGREEKRSPGSCGSAAGTDLSVNPLISGLIRGRTGEVVEVEAEIGIDKGREPGRTGTDTEQQSGAAEEGEMTGIEAEIGMTTGAETGADSGIGDEACAYTPVVLENCDGWVKV